MFCETCGAQIAANAKFCRGCGMPQNAAPVPAQAQHSAAQVVCRNCGAQLAVKAKFCDACGSQSAAEQAVIQTQQAQNADAHTDKSVSGSVMITVVMVIFALFFVIVFGFEDEEGMVVSITAIAFAVFMTGLKWYFEIKAQKRYKREAEEKARR